ncbi:hypothetical protein BGX28_001296 [Mortierella sp. GBA30]|nr:hypothetical protein BGX28_001296 [Mortierella sp. GBA30]
MAPIVPMWWFKEVPVQLETFANVQNSVTHIVPHPRVIETRPTRTQGYENQGGVFAFPNQYAKSVVWRTRDNATCLELISLSGKENTPTRQISFQFNASILPGVHVAPLTQQGGISISLLTVDSVLYRLHISSLSHFLDSEVPEGFSSAAHITWTTNSEPLSFKYLGDRQAAVVSTNGSLFLVKTALLAEDINRHEHADVRVYDLHHDATLLNRIQHVSTIQKLYSRFQSAFDYNLPVGSSTRDLKTTMDIVALETYTTHEDTLLFTLYQDRTIRVWSTGRRQCLQTMRTPPSLNDAGYVQETIDSSLRGHIGVMFNPLMPWVIRLLVYIPAETDAQLSIFTARIDTTEDVEFLPGSTSTMRSDSAAGPITSTRNLVSMQISPSMNHSGYTVWGLWENDSTISARYMQIDDPVVEREQFDAFTSRNLTDNRWWSVAMQAPPRGFIKEMSSVDDYTKDTPQYFADYVFTSGRFSDKTIQRALRITFKDRIFTMNSGLPKQVMEALSIDSPEHTTVAEKEQTIENEILGWTKFISTCAKIDYEAATPLGLSIASDTGYMIIVKQDSLSFLTACDDSEILYHTFQDGQFDVGQFISTPPSQLRSTYPQMQDRILRQDVVKIFRAMEYLTCNINSRVAKTLEGTITQLTMTRGPKGVVETLAQEFLPRYVTKTDMNRARDLAASCSTQTKVLDYLLTQLLQNADSSASGLVSKRCILPYEALVAASVQQLSAHRYAISQKLLMLIAAIFSGAPSSRGWILDETHFISDAMRATQCLLVLKWVSSQVVSSSIPASATSELEQQLSQMQMQEDTPGISPTSYRQSLTGSLLKTLGESGKYGAIEFPIYLAIPRAASKLLYQLGILHCGIGDESKYYAGLAQRLSGMGEMTLLSAFLDFVPMSSSLSYYQGKVLLSEGKSVEALDRFLAVTACFGNGINNVEQELDIMQLDYEPRVNRGHARLDDYYRHIVSLLSKALAHKEVITVAGLALSDLLKAMTEHQTRTLLEAIYTSALSIRSYSVAYNAMMQITSETFRKQYLRVFVSQTCENGDGGKLCLFPFTGLVDEVERMLRHRAESQHVLSKPDPYKTLYAFYCYRGDYRNGASIMYQYARRLADSSNQTESVLALLTEAGHSYLSAINALHLAGPQWTWIAVPAEGGSAEERAKRRKLSVSTNRHTFGLSGLPCKVNIVNISEIKKEYALTMAKLRLVQEIPALMTQGAMIMTEHEAQTLLTHNPEDLIRMYLKFGAIETAAKFSSVVIQAALKKEELISRHSNARWLPYTLLDEIFETMAALIKEAENQVSIKTDTKLEKHLRDLQDIKGHLEEDVRLYLENVQRESIF